MVSWKTWQEKSIFTGTNFGISISFLCHHATDMLYIEVFKNNVKCVWVIHYITTNKGI
jgi:hypothetical protein